MTEFQGVPLGMQRKSRCLSFVQRNITVRYTPLVQSEQIHIISFEKIAITKCERLIILQQKLAEYVSSPLRIANFDEHSVSEGSLLRVSVSTSLHTRVNEIKSSEVLCDLLMFVMFACNL